MNLELNMKGEIILMRAKNYKTNGKALIMAFKLILGGGGPLVQGTLNVIIRNLRLINNLSFIWKN